MSKLLATAVLAAALATPAVAATLNPGDLGYTATIAYAGNTAPGNQSADVTALQVITLNAFTPGANIYSFSYTFVNNSDIPTRLVGFGFDTAPELTNATAGAADLFNQVDFTKQISGGQNVDVCFSTNNCSGGGGGGVSQNGSTSGTFTLDFADGVLVAIDVTNFIARFQSIVGSPFGTSGIAGGTTAGFINPLAVETPIPPAAALFLTGLGALGWLSRRRKAAKTLAAA